MTPIEALQAWLALEHEAVWLYPVIGARRGDLVDRATSSFEAHRDVRDVLLARVSALGADPVTAELAYEVGPIGSASEARAAARGVEARISAATLTLAGIAEGAQRAYAIRGLRRAALAELTWGSEPQPFPGLP